MEGTDTPSFAGIPLCQCPPDVAGWIARTIPLADVVQFNPAPYQNKLLTALPYPDQRQRPIKLGSLWWPQGASRWAVGHFLATEGQLTLIRAVAYPYLIPQPFLLDDGTVQIATNLWMLPPRPLGQCPFNVNDLTKWLLPRMETWLAEGGVNAEPFYLLTLVDDRYFWWDKPSAITINVGTTTWSNLFAQIATGLGVALTIDPIAPAYLTPPAALIAYQQYLPLLLDHAAIGVGKHVVRSLAGAVALQGPVTAKLAQNAALAANPVSMGGGLIALDAA